MLCNKHQRKRTIHQLAELRRLIANPKSALKPILDLLSLLSDQASEIEPDLTSVLNLYMDGDSDNALSMLDEIRRKIALPEVKKSHLNRQIPDEIRSQIVRACASKQTSYKSIADNFGLTETTLRHIRHEAGLPIRHQPNITTFTDAELREALKTTTSQTELAQHFAVSPAAISHRIRFL